MGIELINRIDTHSHIVPPFWKQLCEESGYGQADGIQEIPDWNVNDHIKMMDQLRIAKSILSITSPGTSMVPHLSRKLTRDCNDYTAEVVKQHPDRFGFWASLPLPDVAGALKEIPYALDTLNADGIVMLTNYGGLYIGDPVFDAVFNELNKRNVTIFIHPTTPCVKTPFGPIEAGPLKLWANLIFEFIFEDTRGIMNLFLTGILDKYPNITYISSHAGGTIFSIAERFGIISEHMGPGGKPPPPSLSSHGVRKALAKRFFFDLAGFPFKGRIQGLLEYTGADRLLYGSDFPYTPTRNVEGLSADMDKELVELFGSENEWRKVYYGNAKALLEKGHSGRRSFIEENGGCCGHGTMQRVHGGEGIHGGKEREAVYCEELGPDLVLLREVGPALKRLLRESQG